MKEFGVLGNKRFKELGENDVRALLENEVREGKTIEYKQVLPGKTEKDKKEFLADVSSFANTSGGYIFFGIKENSGVPISILGLPGINADAEILRLENMIQAGIEPRIPGLSYRLILIETSDPVLVLHIQKSWISPHMVSYSEHSRFYARNSAGKYILDVNEIRTAFMASEALSKKINSFRLDRISKIISGETPISLKDGAKIVLHIVPYNFIDLSFNIDITKIATSDKLRPIYSVGGYNSRHNLDGFLNYSDYRSTYTLLFRNGCVEAVNTELMQREIRPEGGFSLYMFPGMVEEEILERAREYLYYQKSIDINPPLVIMLSFTGVNKYYWAYSYGGAAGHPIDRDILILPDIVVENYESDIETTMKPIFDAMWNAAGIAKSPFYDEAGKRKPR